MSLCATETPLLLAIAVGSLLRSHQLSAQIIVYDEWHTLRSAIGLDYAKIYTSFGDHSAIPISLYLRAMLETVGLGQWTLRAPFLAAGVATILLPPLLARRYLGRATSDLFAWLLSLSPLLIYHSRFARPYAISTLCGVLAIYFVHRCWEREDWRAGAAYAALVSVTGFFTMAHLPFVLSPFLYFLAAWVLSGRKRTLRPLARLSMLGALTLALLLGLLGPALLLDHATIGSKLRVPPQGVEVEAIVRMATGCRSDLLGVVLVFLASLGALALGRARAGLCSYLLTVGVLQIASVLILEPRQYTQPPVFCRYVLPTIVIGLLFAAIGLNALVTHAVRAAARLSARSLPGWASRVATAAVVLSVALAGPQRELFVHPSGWVNESMTSRLQFPEVDPSRLVLRLSRFYRDLEERPPASVAVIEAPYTAFGLYAPYSYYQLRHRQTTWVASEFGACEPENTSALAPHPGFRLPYLFFLADTEAIEASGADFLVIHKDFPREVSFYREGSWYARMLRTRGEGCVGYAIRRWGSPWFEDDDLAVFSLRQQTARARDPRTDSPARSARETGLRDVGLQESGGAEGAVPVQP